MQMSTVTKKLINAPYTCADESIEGFLALNPGLRQLNGHRVVFRGDLDAYKKDGKVVLLTGGGSGHEPIFMGYIGQGMMTGAVHGAVFAAPPSNSILAALRVAGKDHPAGVILLFNNYTGDRLNFGIAVEQARAEGIKVDMVINGEDCAVMHTQKTVGRRGLAGLVFLIKIAGALAQDGASFEEILHTSRTAGQAMGTVGICLAPCSAPGGPPMFEVPHDAIELGLGLHGEAGAKRVKMMTAKDTVSTMLDLMTLKTNPCRLHLQAGDHVAVLINNLGATSVMEINIVTKEVINYLKAIGVHVDRAYAGWYAASQEMAGVSITLMHLDQVRKRLLDAEAGAPAWVKPVILAGCEDWEPCTALELPDVDTGVPDSTLSGCQLSPEMGSLVYCAVHSVCEALISAESNLNLLDSGSGDGDCGSTLKAGAEAILKQLGTAESPGLPVRCPQSLLLSLASIAQEAMGGCSGALYGLFLAAASSALHANVNIEDWTLAIQQGTQAITKYGGAEPGDRTMLDPLAAVHASLVENSAKLAPLEALQLATKAAETRAEETAKMAAKAGRSTYVAAECLTQPDPGARGVAIWLRAVYSACAKGTSKHDQ